MGRGCWSIERGTCAAGPSLRGVSSWLMGSRWSWGMRRGPKAPGPRRNVGRCACVWSSSSGGGCSMCHPPEPSWCAAGACMPTRRGRRWQCAGSSSARGRWRCPCRGIGNARARSGVRRIRNVVRSVGGAWCARRSSPGPASPHPQRRLGSRWHERAHERRHAAALPPGTGVPCRGVPRGVCVCMRFTPAPQPADCSADRPPRAAPCALRSRDARVGFRSKLHRGACTSPLSARVVQPGVEADRGQLGGRSVRWSRGRLTLSVSCHLLFD
jgi:hypothetical protein